MTDFPVKGYLSKKPAVLRLFIICFCVFSFSIFFCEFA
nr:MAG TPA: hypothetical protein [Caudoviricetes sp.]